MRENKNIKKSELEIDRSLGTQVQLKEDGGKIYSVKEVCQITGLSRKQLFDYKDIVKPTAYDKSGYKLYDKASLNQLKTVSELRQIGVSLVRIKMLLDGEFSMAEIVRSQIEILNEQKRHIEIMLDRAECLLKMFVY